MAIGFTSSTDNYTCINLSIYILRWFIVNCPQSASSSIRQQIHWSWELDTEAETLWQVYEGVTATNPLANAITPYNSNRNSSNTSGTTMKYEKQTNLAAANADTDVSGGTLIEQGISGSGRQTAGNAVRSHEIILKQNTLYCLRATATAAGYINFNMQWYEHTDKH